MDMKLYRQRFLSMGCPCEIGVFSADAKKAEQAMAEAENEVHRLDQKYSHFRNDSYITQVQNTARQSGGVDVDAETASLLDYAASQFEISQGLFDITAGRLARLWYRRESLPTDTELSSALQLTGWAKLQWQSPWLRMPKGMQLELGGIVKEYAADRAALLLKRNGMHSAWVELGGDIHVTGSRADGKPWNMGIRSPDHQHQKTAKAMATIPVNGGGLATSGDYERASIINGKRYGHIIHPGTGWPVNSFQSVSVLAPSCLLAGSLSTLAMLMGPKDGLNMLTESGFTWLTREADGTDFCNSLNSQQDYQHQLGQSA
jgi:thiamine biosynthesis lipoprotein